MAMVGTDLDSMIKAMVVACILPYVWAILAKKLGGFGTRHNQDPRAFLAQLEGMAARANAAQANSFEGLPMFLAGVWVASYCFVPQVLINGYAWGYVVLRVLFGVCYLANWAILRSVVWALSLACSLMLYVLAMRMV